MHISRPDTLCQALQALTETGAQALAGGTNVMVDIKKGRAQAASLVSIDMLDELKKIENKDDGIHIGSLVTFTQLEEWLGAQPELMQQTYQALYQAASLVGGPQIRNRGTVGGNILCASPSSDSMPALLVLDAKLRLLKCSEDGSSIVERIVPLEGFVTGVRRTSLQPGELLAEIIVPAKTGRSCFYKAGTRKAMAISIANQALYLELDENGVITEAAAACGSVAPVVVRVPKAEQYLIGKTADEFLGKANGTSTDAQECRQFGDQECTEAMIHVRKLLENEISPITDLRAERDYRLLVSCNMLEENLKTLLGGN